MSRFKWEELIVSNAMDNDLSREKHYKTRQSQQGVDVYVTLAELSGLSVSVEADTPIVTLYEYLMNLNWDSLAARRLQKTANGGRLFHSCFADDHQQYRDYKSIHSGPQAYPEFEPWVPQENTACVEAMKASADRHSRLGGATVVLVLSVLNLLV